MTAEELLEADSDSVVIVLDRGIAVDGRACWVYIAVRPSKYDAFMHAVKMRVHKNYEDYGTVLRYGYGGEVPASVKEEMKHCYGCDDNYMDNLLKDVKSARVAFLQEKEDRKIKEFLAMMKQKVDDG
ncbi:MAG TPA: hypothetical protein VFV38_33095 [Ktedonobacteraceae bacterium]|nr:hypothetical protein [Ktedonobacteraceae bacterium]